MGTPPKRSSSTSAGRRESVPRRRPRVRSLKAYVALWTGAILFSFLLLIAAWFTVQANLRLMRQRTVADARALDAARELRNHLLNEEREDLLWRATGDAAHRDAKLAALREAVEVAQHLDTAGVPLDEAQLAQDIRTRLLALGDAAAPQAPPPIEKSRPAIDELLAAVRRYIARNELDMEATAQAALQLQGTMDRWAIGVVGVVAVLLAAGSLGLVRRVIRPTLELTHAARGLGQGDLSARAAVTRDDELGALCRTFNAMAEDTADHERARLEFVALVAHDLKNPLVTIGGGIRRLLNPALTPEQHADWRHRIAQEAARLEKLTHDLMDTVQVSTGRLRLNKGELDLTALLRELVAEQAEVVCDHELTFQGEEECRILADRDRIERVAVNLISNAAKYSPRGTAIEVKVARSRSAAVFTVRDEGTGIAPEELAAIFQPFGRGAHAHRWAKGTGLGLNVVKQIIEAHGGSINIESPVAEGTTIEILLPLAPGSQGEGSGS